MLVYWLFILAGIVAHDNGAHISAPVLVTFIALGVLKLIVEITTSVTKALKK